MIIYMILIVFYFIVGLKELQQSNSNFKRKFIRNLLLSVPLWIIIGFRGLSVGNDTIVYEHLFEQFSDEPLVFSLVSSNIEKGFIILCSIIGDQGVDFHGFILILASINVICYSFFFAKYSKNFGFSWLLFITLLFLPRCMNICREMLAVSLSLFSIGLLLRRKILYFVIFCILLTFVHKSAVLILLVLILVKIRDEKKRIWATIIMCIVLSILFQPIMSYFVSFAGGKYDYLIGSIYSNTDGGIAKYLMIGFSFIAYWCISTIEKASTRSIDENFKYSNDIWKCLIMMSIVFAFAGLNFGLADRASLYFFTAYLICMPNSLYYRSAMPMTFRYILLNSLFISYFIVVMVYRNNWHTIIPYSFWWE